MKRLCVVCEGQTEAEFVQRVLGPHLLAHGVQAAPSKLKSRPSAQGGGNVSLPRLARHLRNEYWNFDYLTTLVDYYGFKDRGNCTPAALEAAIGEQTRALVDVTEDRKLRPYVQRHEFEALLFADIEAFEWLLDAWTDATRAALCDIRDRFPDPEAINDGTQTAPSKRLEQVFAGRYSKTEHGPLIAESIGLERIRGCCPRFHQWLTTLEALA